MQNLLGSLGDKPFGVLVDNHFGVWGDTASWRLQAEVKNPNLWIQNIKIQMFKSKVVQCKPFGGFFCEFPDFGGVSKMAAPRQYFFDNFNGQGPRSAWGPPETIQTKK